MTLIEVMICFSVSYSWVSSIKEILKQLLHDNYKIMIIIIGFYSFTKILKFDKINTYDVMLSYARF